jgi:hypothetical protein
LGETLFVLELGTGKLLLQVEYSWVPVLVERFNSAASAGDEKEKYGSVIDGVE